MKTYTLIISIFAIGVVQGIFAEEALKCKSSCFEGCDTGVCNNSFQCTGCSRKYYVDKQKAKEKIKLLKIKDEKKIEEIKKRNESEMDQLTEKHESEMSTLVESHKKSYEELVSNLNSEMEEVLASQKVKLLAMRATHFEEIKQLNETHALKIKELREEHKRSIKTTKIVLQNVRTKKEKELETICSGSHCPSFPSWIKFWYAELWYNWMDFEL